MSYDEGKDRRWEDAIACMYKALAAKEQGAVGLAQGMWRQALELYTALGADWEIHQVRRLMAEFDGAGRGDPAPSQSA